MPHPAKIWTLSYLKTIRKTSSVKPGDIIRREGTDDCKAQVRKSRNNPPASSRLS
jgi:hypothetical protein